MLSQPAPDAGYSRAGRSWRRRVRDAQGPRIADRATLETAPPLTQVDREPGILNAVDEPPSRGFLQLPDQKSANPLASPGGHVEDGESHEDAAVRELAEETTLRARAGELLWTGLHNGRPASYYLMEDVTGEPVLSGPEAEEDCAENRFELRWAGPADFDALGLHPADVREPLARLLRERR
ncbi:NUDIX hydrolase [Streptomyces sp. NPDC021020]|uniref:NUDIX hydrolase n=1 Tax=Streptomyces sp. NPDC021020 TaxID=3365109 RepID=UPI00379DB3B1